ncbi:MAG: L,D-transpeptidase family protein [Syntrophales bacterium]|nr:L,D-transpeptidase family protein [Syntrophales bacterium]
MTIKTAMVGQILSALAMIPPLMATDPAYGEKTGEVRDEQAREAPGKNSWGDDPLPAGVLDHVLAAAEAAWSQQEIVIRSSHPAHTQATALFLERGDRGWQRALADAPAVLGRAGIVPPGEKREGDGRTPGGLFPLDFAFGYGTSSSTRMPSRAVGEDDVWVDDPHAPDYNRLTKKSATKAKSFEIMKSSSGQYKLGLVIAYNTNPIVAGLGSAIFIHIRDEAGKPTAGCVAFTEETLIEILQRLDPEKRPYVAVLTNHGERGATSPHR